MVGYYFYREIKLKGVDLFQIIFYNNDVDKKERWSTSRLSPGIGTIGRVCKPFVIYEAIKKKPCVRCDYFFLSKLFSERPRKALSTCKLTLFFKRRQLAENTSSSCSLSASLQIIMFYNAIPESNRSVLCLDALPLN